MKRLVLGLTLVAFAIALLPGTASAAEITGFVGCDENAENPQPSHKCLTTDSPAAYFESSEEIEYEACLFEGPVEELTCSPADPGGSGNPLPELARSTGGRI